MAATPELPGPMTPRRYMVLSRALETADTVTLALASLDEPLPAGRPGQFHMLYVYGVGEVPISISGLPDRKVRPLFHTVRSVGAVTRPLAAAEPGTVLGLRGPFGTDWGVDRAVGHDVVVIAGGIGLAPLRPAFEHLLANRDDYGRVALLVGARTPADLIFSALLTEWRARFDAQVEVTVDAASSRWRGDVGVVTNLVPRVSFDPDRTIGLVCGPEVMMRFAARALAERGVGRDRILVSLERNMHCGLGHCGHCQLGPFLLCRDGPVVPYSLAAGEMAVRER